jgi:hypothetical protein
MALLFNGESRASPERQSHATWESKVTAVETLEMAFTDQAKQLCRGWESGGMGPSKEGWLALNRQWNARALSRF